MKNLIWINYKKNKKRNKIRIINYHQWIFKKKDIEWNQYVYWEMKYYLQVKYNRDKVNLEVL